MSDQIRNTPGPDESKLPAAFRKRRVERHPTEPASADTAASRASRGAFEQVLGEEMGSVQRMSARPGPAEEAPVESLLISKSLGAIYKSFLNTDF